ncbi:MAG: CDP-glycerol glycerophosphotransferase family protein [Patescibacteria group bacterium]
MDDRQTIFIPIGRAGHVRNLLYNDFIDLLAAKYRVVFLVSEKDPEFCKRFGKFEIEMLVKRPLTAFKKKLETVFISIHRALIFNPSSEVFSGMGRGTSVSGVLLKNGELVKYKRLRYFLAKKVFGGILAGDGVRAFFKRLDRMIFPCHSYDALIDKYKTALVFITSIGSDDQVALLRNCKMRGVLSVAMASSWDNVSKWGFREKADLFIVWSSYMRDEARHFQGYKENEIKIIGIPQFDHYVKPDIYSREEFISKFHLDPTKKTILFGSEGPICTDDPYIVSFLQKKIKDGTLAGYQILVRPHFGYGERDTGRYTPLVDNETVFMDNFSEVSNFKDSTALSLNTVINLIAEIRYCAVAITSTSTLVLDILANEKMPILYYFDEIKNKPYKESVKRLYHTLWFQEILKFGLDNMADSEEELVKKIKELTVNPGKDLGKRVKLMERLCYRVDGESGRRLFEVINGYLVNNNSSL